MFIPIPLFVPSPSRDSALAFVFERTRALDRVLDRAHARALDQVLTRALSLDQALDLDSARALDSTRALDLYITLFLLQERIAGKLPAYEGILLVKDREQGKLDT